MTRFARARQVGDAVVDVALDAIADSVPAPASPASSARSSSIRTRSSARRSSTPSSICRSTARSRGGWSTRRRSIGRSPSGRAKRPITGVTGPDGQARRVPDPRRGDARHPCHEPLRNAVGAERPAPAPALVGAGAAAVRVCGVRSRDRRGRVHRRHAGRRLVSGGDKYAENERLKIVVQPRRHVRGQRQGDRRRPITASPRSRTWATSATSTTTRRPPPIAGSPAPTRASPAVSRLGGGPLRAGLRVELDLPLPRSASADRTGRAAESVTVPVTIEATLDAGSPRVAFAVSVDNRAADHRLRLLFPTGAASVDTARADTAFDVITRPARIAGAGHDPERVAGQQHADDLDGRRRRRRDGATVIGRG